MCGFIDIYIKIIYFKDINSIGIHVWYEIVKQK